MSEQERGMPETTRRAIEAAASPTVTKLAKSVSSAVAASARRIALLQSERTDAWEALVAALDSSLAANDKPWVGVLDEFLSDSTRAQAIVNAAQASVSGTAARRARDLVGKLDGERTGEGLAPVLDTALKALRANISADMGGEDVEADDGWLASDRRAPGADEAWADVLVAYGIITRLLAPLLGAAARVRSNLDTDYRAIQKWNTDKALKASGLAAGGSGAAAWLNAFPVVLVALALYLALAVMRDPDSIETDSNDGDEGA